MSPLWRIATPGAGAIHSINGGQWLAVEEDQLRRVEPGLEIEPGLAPRSYVLARLLAGARDLFLYVAPWRR